MSDPVKPPAKPPQPEKRAVPPVPKPASMKPPVPKPALPKVPPPPPKSAPPKPALPAPPDAKPMALSEPSKEREPVRVEPRPEPAPPPRPASAPEAFAPPLGRPSPLGPALEWGRRSLARVRERTKDRPRWFLPAVGGGSAFVLLILVLAAGKAACGSSSSAAASVTAQPSSAASQEVAAPPASAPAAPPASAPARPMACVLAGSPRTLAPKALAANGLEVSAVGSQIAVGFGPTPRDATLDLIDPSTLASSGAKHVHVSEPIHAVLALPGGKAQVDVAHKDEVLQGRSTLVADPPIDVGAVDGGFGWAPHLKDKAIKLWPLPNPTAPIEAVRGDALADSKGFAVAFRQGGVVYAGAFGGSPPGPIGPLLHVDGLGTTVGLPALAASGDRVLVAWSDRAADANPWSVRLARFHPGDDAPVVRTFTPPAGGLGGQAMSPDLVSLGGGRFLLVWTEGQSTHQVRGAIVNESGAASDPFVVSAEGVDAGQGRAAVLPDGRGVVAFFSSGKLGFEVVARPIKCAEK